MGSYKSKMFLIIFSSVFSLFVCVFIVCIICIIYMQKRYNLKNKECSILFSEKFSLENLNLSMNIKLGLLKERNDEYSEKINSINEKLAYANEQIVLYKTKSELIENFDKRLTEQFTNISNAILLRNSNNFISLAKEELSNVTESLRNRFIEYEKSHAKTTIELETNTRNFNDNISKLSEEVDKVTRAFYGNNKTHGTWGEMILEKTLEISGLQPEVHYYNQKSVTTNENFHLKPDVIINLPDDQKIIIDSKLSFKDYNDYVNSSDDNEKSFLLKNIKVAIKNHIDTLYKKDYQNYKTSDSVYHSILMFIPIESLFVLLMHEGKENLVKYAYDRNVIITSPHTLLISLKNIRYLWSSFEREKSTRDAFIDLENILNKVILSLNSFNDFGVALSTLTKRHEEIISHLFSGRGNVKNKIILLKNKYNLELKELKDVKYIPQKFIKDEFENVD